MVTHAQNKLFTPVQIGPITLKDRIVMPPMSRLRARWPSGVAPLPNLSWMRSVFGLLRRRSLPQERDDCGYGPLASR
jgi:hypothetical protein